MVVAMRQDLPCKAGTDSQSTQSTLHSLAGERSISAACFQGMCMSRGLPLVELIIRPASLDFKHVVLRL